jgi:hypothetical protein
MIDSVDDFRAVEGLLLMRTDNFHTLDD